MRHAVVQFRAVPEERVPSELLAWRPQPPPPPPKTPSVDRDSLRPRVPCRVMMAIDVVPGRYPY